jgi:5-methyltetrahydropteroyltriglutamate--homocysteine methyltransferase
VLRVWVKIKGALRLQEEAGVAVVTDGEMRRMSFQSQVPAAVEGFSDWDLDAFLWGDWQGDEEVGELRVERPDLAVVGKLRRRRSLCAEEFAYARGRTDRVLKVTLPCPSLFANFWDPERAPPEYRTLEDFSRTWRRSSGSRPTSWKHGSHLSPARCPHYTMVLDPRYRDFGFHLCRGNQASRWLVEGGYEAVAEQIFGAIHARRLLLEYDDPRSGASSRCCACPRTAGWSSGW